LRSPGGVHSYAKLFIGEVFDMELSAQDALIHLMVAAAASDEAISGTELERIQSLVERTPIFAGFDQSRLEVVANACIDVINAKGLDAALDAATAALPHKLQDTAYALAVEITVVDLRLPQEELRLLEMIRDRLTIDRLVTAAIEASARARMRTAA
jgi:uncharacterized membrane protein YebE (DUF533 family)